jgi:hypothetical protein
MIILHANAFSGNLNSHIISSIPQEDFNEHYDEVVYFLPCISEVLDSILRSEGGYPVPDFMFFLSFSIQVLRQEFKEYNDYHCFVYITVHHKTILHFDTV